MTQAMDSNCPVVHTESVVASFTKFSGCSSLKGTSGGHLGNSPAQGKASHRQLPSTKPSWF